ncbi:AAEL014563-PA, partial [Aedes aegypti]
MANVNAELLGQLSAMIAEALQASIGNAIQQVNAGAQNQANDAAAPTPKIPTFSMSEYRPSDGSSVADYFSRFKWALELSQIPQVQYANYARVHMGAELNNALKFLVSPQDPATIDFKVLQTTLVNHFDRKKNKYVESVKFRQIVQQTGESRFHDSDQNNEPPTSPTSPTQQQESKSSEYKGVVQRRVRYYGEVMTSSNRSPSTASDGSAV